SRQARQRNQNRHGLYAGGNCCCSGLPERGNPVCPDDRAAPNGRKARAVTFDDIRAIALAFPGVVAATSYGTPSLKVGSKFLLREREPGVLALQVTGLEVKDFLLEAEPEMFFTTPHYDGYPYVLARLERLDAARFTQLF